jgi:NAD(P)-dependent dehydrogenase (short-subunit alcohol dehydrogenase family)
MSDSPISRRRMVGGVASGLAVAATQGAFAMKLQDKPQDIQQNPIPEYPHPPFPKQEQPWPGLASKMDPRPDHGETSYRGSSKLAGRKALITGADSGIGRAVAIAFSREGADVAMNYLAAEEPDAQEVVELIRKDGRKCVPIPGDIREEAFCQALVDKAARELGGLDIVVNVAGRQKSVPHLKDVSSESFDWTIKTNIYALFWIIKAALPHLKPGSAIINTASEQAIDPSPDLTDYAGTKAFILNYSKSLAKQLAPDGIRVNAIAPGPFWTPLQVSGGAQMEKVVHFGDQTPYKRPGQPAEIAPLYVLLASQEASYSSGQVFGAQGGAGVI